jgi:hypothetical protein
MTLDLRDLGEWRESSTLIVQMFDKNQSRHSSANGMIRGFTSVLSLNFMVLIINSANVNLGIRPAL